MTNKAKNILSYQNLDVIAQTVNTGTYLSGSTFTYTSIIATEPDMLNPDTLPRGIQLVFIGNNALNQPVVNTFAILYNNDCGVFPLLREGQVAGWSIFVSHSIVHVTSNVILRSSSQYRY